MENSIFRPIYEKLKSEKIYRLVMLKGHLTTIYKACMNVGFNALLMLFYIIFVKKMCSSSCSSCDYRTNNRWIWWSHAFFLWKNTLFYEKTIMQVSNFGNNRDPLTLPEKQKTGISIRILKRELLHLCLRGLSSEPVQDNAASVKIKVDIDSAQVKEVFLLNCQLVFPQYTTPVVLYPIWMWDPIDLNISILCTRKRALIERFCKSPLWSLILF